MSWWVVQLVLTFWQTRIEHKICDFRNLFALFGLQTSAGVWIGLRQFNIVSPLLPLWFCMESILQFNHLFRLFIKSFSRLQSLAYDFEFLSHHLLRFDAFIYAPMLYHRNLPDLTTRWIKMMISIALSESVNLGAFLACCTLACLGSRSVNG